MPANDEVGYGKPPKKHQFKKGQSGNPKGRPPKTMPDAASVAASLDGDVSVKKGQANARMHAFEASVRKLVSKAVNDGDVQAAVEFLRLCDKYGVVTPAPEPVTGGVLTVPKDWDWDEWMAMFHDFGPPPWPGKRSGLPE